jgi:hypothetical protein
MKSHRRFLGERDGLDRRQPNDFDIALIVADYERRVVHANRGMIGVRHMKLSSADEVNRERRILMQKPADFFQGHGVMVRTLSPAASNPRAASYLFPGSMNAPRWFRLALREQDQRDPR